MLHLRSLKLVFNVSRSDDTTGGSFTGLNDSNKLISEQRFSPPHCGIVTLQSKKPLKKHSLIDISLLHCVAMTAVLLSLL